ncbi:hypothetical protein RJ640_029306 [Escallonia rubra]|uniref:Uncharacterized protein n=1 Tax=Escallonia rubra TaxID=112253 RepID=A0AA88R4M5_9ASTE|nr:hypothetical protein RJ640_029306 [Escallonia rubra]
MREGAPSPESAFWSPIFSRYGIHSLPTILVVNRTSRMRFRGTKDLHSLVKFYKMATGHEPVHYVAMEQPISPRNSEKWVLQSWIGTSPKEILTRELYLVLSVLFVALRLFAYLLPKVLSRFKAFWVSYGPHLNMEIFGETSQMLGRVLQMVDVKRVWTKLSIICKIRNLHQGAKNTRVWASSLASVSLGGAS